MDRLSPRPRVRRCHRAVNNARLYDDDYYSQAQSLTILVTGGAGGRIIVVERPPPGLPQPRNFAHPEFTAFTTKAKKLFTKWQTATVPQLKGLAKDGHP